MTRDNAHLYLPLVQALAAGQTIQANRGTVDEPRWEDLPEAVLFTCEPHLYRVAPGTASRACARPDEGQAYEAWFLGEQGKPYEGMWQFARAAWMHRAAAAFLASGAPVDGDRVSVPQEPTSEMLDAWNRTGPTAEHAYAAMLAAAPPALTHPVADCYYIQDTRQYVGNCPMWWGRNGEGYTAHLARAGRYSKDQAMRQAATRSTDVAWPCAVIDAIATPMVDMQDMRSAGACQT